MEGKENLASDYATRLFRGFLQSLVISIDAAQRDAAGPDQAAKAREALVRAYHQASQDLPRQLRMLFADIDLKP